MDDLRAGFAVRQPQLADVQMDRSPLERLDLAQPTTGEQKEPESRYGVKALRSDLLIVGERDAKSAEFLGRQEALALVLWKPFDVLAGIGVLVAQAPHFGQVHHLGQDAQGAIGLVGDVGEAALELRDIGRRDSPNALGFEERIDEQLDAALVLGARRRLAAHGDMLLEEPCAKLRHRDRLTFCVALRGRIGARPLHLPQ